MSKASSALLSATGAKALDAEASAQWGLHPFALVEAAGRACAGAFARAHVSEKRGGLAVIVFAGKGNNAADALVMLRALILGGYAKSSSCMVFGTAALPAAVPGDTPLSAAIIAIQKLGVPFVEWNAGKIAETAKENLARADIIIDGIVGTGLEGPLRGTPQEMVETLNALERSHVTVVSIDIPSGNLAADITLAIEPQKLYLYTPSARPYAGTIIPVGGIFPPALIDKHREADLIEWEAASAQIPHIPPTAHKYERGVVEVWAGSPGAAGAARLAASGAQSAGAGLVRLIVDASLYPILAPGCCGIMVTTVKDERFAPSAVLLGPGWGRGQDRMRLLETYLPLEEQGLPLILDADAIALARDMVFHGNALITPHVGEFAAYTGLPKDQILGDPIPVLRRFAMEKNIHILLKGHVSYAVSPDGRVGVIDGMNAALAAGGSGDVLAGFCAAIAARRQCDLYACACAAASLLIKAAESEHIAGRFFDPAELACAAAVIAGETWLKTESREQGAGSREQ